MLNKVIMQGRLCADPELRYTQGGVSVTSFSIAVDRDIKSKDGEKQTDFFDCTAWRGTAEFITKNFHKGQLAIVDGSIENRDWVDNNGVKRRNSYIQINKIYFGEKKQESTGTGGGYYKGVSGDPNQFEELEDYDDSDLPY